MKIFRFIVVVSCFALHTSGVSANDAKQNFEEGLALFQKGQFEEAAKMFRKANEQRPNWRILYNLGQSEAAAKQYGLAISSFEKYLSQGGDEIPDARRAYVIKELQQMREMVGYLEIKAPDGIEIYIDGIHRGLTPFSMNLPVAASVEHELVAYMEGNQVNSKVVMVMGQQTAVVTVEIESVKLESSSGIDWGKEDGSAEEQRAEVPITKVEPNGSMMKTASFIVGGLGAAALLTGTVTGLVALKKNGDVTENCQDGCYSDQYNSVDSRDSFARATDVLLIGGAVLLTTGAVLLFASKRRQKKEVAMIPALIPGGFFSTATVRF